jgi:hypothetical protein
MDKRLKQQLADESVEERARRERSLNAPAREAFEAARPALSPAQRRVLAGLVDDGIAHAPMTDLVGEDWWDRLRAGVEPWIASDEVRTAEEAYRASDTRRWKDYLVRMFGRGATLPFDSPWIQFALQPAILDLINTYLGMLSKILYVDVWDTVPLVHAGADTGSQRWHRDPEDAKLVKVFLYFSDVDAAAGAMQYVPRSRSGEQYGQLWPQRFPSGSVPPPDEFDRLVPPWARVTCAHAAGTLLFVDTSGFHRGGRAPERRRVLSTWTYTSQSSVWPRAFQVTNVPGSLSPPVRFALL